MNWRAFGETFVTLFVITDPIGNAPIFVSITRKLTPRQRQGRPPPAPPPARAPGTRSPRRARGRRADHRLRRVRRADPALPARVAGIPVDRRRAAAAARRAGDA